VETAQSNVTLAEAVLKQAENQKAAGTGTGIEITRAKVQLANDASGCWWPGISGPARGCN